MKLCRNRSNRSCTTIESVPVTVSRNAVCRPEHTHVPIRPPPIADSFSSNALNAP